jgi:hypothetical protein
MDFSPALLAAAVLIHNPAKLRLVNFAAEFLAM